MSTFTYSEFDDQGNETEVEVTHNAKNKTPLQVLADLARIEDFDGPPKKRVLYELREE